MAKVILDEESYFCLPDPDKKVYPLFESKWDDTSIANGNGWNFYTKSGKRFAMYRFIDNKNHMFPDMVQNLIDTLCYQHSDVFARNWLRMTMYYCGIRIYNNEYRDRSFPGMTSKDDRRIDKECLDFVQNWKGSFHG
jgi:hypothetical protein